MREDIVAVSHVKIRKSYIKIMTKKKRRKKEGDKFKGI